MPAKLADANTTRAVVAYVQRARADYYERNTLMLGIRRQRFLRARVSPPQSYARFLGQGAKIPIAYRLIQTVIGAVAGEERPHWHATSPDPELSGRTEKWCKLSVQTQETVSQRALYWKFWDSLAGDGFAVLKTQRNPWTNFPLREDGEGDSAYNDKVKAFYMAKPPVPFQTRVLDPMTFYPPRSEWGTPAVIEDGMRPADQVMHAMGLRPSPTGRLRVADASEPVPRLMTALGDGSRPYYEVTEVWTPNNLFVVLQGQVWEYENTEGEIPYQWASGSAIAFSDPTLQAMSAAFPLIYLEPWINQTLSTLVGFAQLQATPTPTTTQEGGSPGVSTEPVITDFQPGMLHQFGAGVKAGVWDMGKPAESVAILNTLVQLAERFTISPVPAFAGSRTAGTALAQIAERVMSILRPMVDQAQVTWGEQGKFWLRICKDRVKAPVFLSGFIFEERKGRGKAADTALTPRDIARLGDLHAEIRFRTTTDRIAWDTHNVMMNQSGLWSKKRSRLESDVEDPEDEEQQVNVEALLANPAIQLYIMQAGMRDQPPLQALIEIIGQMQQGAGGPPGGPAEGGEASGLPAGATAGVPRAAGGERLQAPAPKGRMRESA